MSIPCNNYPGGGYYAPKASEGLKDLDVSKIKVSYCDDLPEEVAYDSSLEEDLMANLKNLFDDAYSLGYDEQNRGQGMEIIDEYVAQIQNIILLAVRNNLP